jgi:hypothetical protein
MRMVNGVDVLSVSGRKSQARGARVTSGSPGLNFAVLAQQISQRQAPASTTVTANGATSGQRQRSAAPTVQINTDVPYSIATDPVLNFRSTMGSASVELLENIDWYEKNNIGQYDWNRSFTDKKSTVIASYNRISSLGLNTPEMDAEYAKVMKALDDHGKERAGGKEFSHPVSFNGVLRSDVPLSKEEIRNRIAEALKRPGGVMAFTQK